MHQFRTVLPLFDKFLESKGLRLEATVVGGAALQLLGVIERVTKDCDVLYPELPEVILIAAREFAGQNNLPKDWLNNGPSSLIRDLPSGWEGRRRDIFTGRALRLLSLGSEDLLRSKLYAYLDRGIDLDDIRALKPSPADIEALIPWLQERDGNPQWPEYVKQSMVELIEVLNGGE
jgi:Nucleotidyltransferase of unknown function (DUF6036)